MGAEDPQLEEPVRTSPALAQGSGVLCHKATVAMASAQPVPRGISEKGTLRGCDVVLKCHGRALTTPSNSTVFVMYKPKLEPFDTEEAFPLSLEGFPSAY